MRGRGSWAAVAVLHERRVVVFVIPVLAVIADGDVQAALFAAAASMPVILGGTRLHLGFVLAVVAALVIQEMKVRMFIGFQLKVSCMAPLAAKYAGFRPKRLLWVSMLISGGLGGLAGVAEVAGPVGQLTLIICPGYGFAAIIVAFVGRLSPAGCIPAAFVMALFYLGCVLGQSRLGVPSSITGVYQGMLLFFLLICDSLIYMANSRFGQIDPEF